jgi:hypothetical protein
MKKHVHDPLPDDPNGYVSLKRFFGLFRPYVTPEAAKLMDRAPHFGKDPGPRGQEKPLLLPKAPPPQWKIEARASQTMRPGRQSIDTYVTLGTTTTHLLEEDLFKEYGKAFTAWVTAHKKSVKVKKWIGSENGTNPGLIRTADITAVLYRLTCTPK